ncbi:MAG: hypothetical protein AB1497_11615 [Bacillota bacterium]
MGRILIVLCVVTVCILVAFSSVPTAASTPGRFGETVQPLFETQVELVSEDVWLYLDETHALIEATYLLYNPGSRRELTLMGLPEFSGVANPLSRLPNVSVDDQEYEVRQETYADDAGRRENISFWYAWQVTFEPGQTRVIKVSYTIPTYEKSDNLRMLGYRLAPGKSWKGKPREVSVTVHGTGVLPFQVVSAMPATWKVESGRYVWRFSGDRPFDEISIAFEPREDLLQHVLSPEQARQLLDHEKAERYNEALAVLMSVDLKVLEEKWRNLVQAREAFLRYKIGQKTRAVYLWEELLERQVPDLSAYYYLALHYYGSGDLDNLKLVHENLKRAQINPALHRWIASLLPVTSVGQSSPEVLEIAVSEEQGGNVRLSARVRDIDGDLVRVSVSLTGNDNVYVDQTPSFDLQPYTLTPTYIIPAVPMYTMLYAKVTAVDSAGNETVYTENFLWQSSDWSFVEGSNLVVSFRGAYQTDRAAEVHWSLESLIYRMKRAFGLSPKAKIYVNLVADDRLLATMQRQGFRPDFIPFTDDVSAREKFHQLYRQLFIRIMAQNGGAGWNNASDWLVDAMIEIVRDEKTKEAEILSNLFRDRQQFLQFVEAVGTIGDVDRALYQVFGFGEYELKRKIVQARKAADLGMALYIGLASVLFGSIVWRLVRLKRAMDRKS